MSEEATNIDFLKLFVYLSIPLLILGLSGYVFSLTPYAQEIEKERQDELHQMSCRELFAEMKNSIPHGYTVGGADTELDRYAKEITNRGCIEK